MAKITITFESASQLPNGPHVESYEVDEAYAPDFAAAIAAHQVHGYVIETKTVQVQEGVDANGNPIMVDRETTTRSPGTFQTGLTSWANMNVRDVIFGAVNTFRRRKAEAIALAQINVPEIKPVEKV